ncbi:MAG: DUF1476 domain-containing protein [Paracoccaceae bacterium]
MTTFDERERAFENKYAHDAEMTWKAEARRNRLLGLWAAERMGLSGEDASTYAKAVVKADFEEAGDMDVFRKVKADLDAKGQGIEDTELRAKMDALLKEAKAQLMGEFGG